MRKITSEIKKIGIDLGFDKIGISPAAQPSKSANLETFLKKGFYGSMDWMATHQKKRMDIEKLFPGAKSVICVAQKKLKTYLEKIKEIDPTIGGRLCVDTAPIMEKLWAEQAGLGWQGKNTNLITREFGSWIFLGEIIIDGDLDYDVPIEDFCGSCQACLDACPTDALIAPYVMDARKCISYLTIEFWDKPIPADLKKNMYGWIFGCDICQDVCPWNKFAKKSTEERYRPKKNAMEFDLSELEELDESMYKNKFKKSPVLRPGWKDFQRNIKAVKK
jgi:epoxyqueuosine reductase